MRFSRVATTIKAMEQKQSLTLNDALNLFQDLCEDIRDDQNVTADRLPCGDEDEAVTRLAWMCRTILRMAGQLPVESIDQDRLSRLKKVEDDVTRASERLKEIAEGLEVLKERAGQLRQTEADLSRALEKDKQLKEECRRLEDSIREYEELKLPGLSGRKEQLSREAGVLQKAYDKLRDSCNQQEEDNRKRQDAIQEEKIRFAEMKNVFQELKEQKEKLEEEVRKLEDQYQELKNRLQNTDASRRGLVEQIESLEQSLSRTDIESLRQLYEERTKEVEAREQEQKKLEDGIRQQEEALDRLKKTMEEKSKRTQEMVWDAEAEEKKARTSLELLENRMKEAQTRRQELMSQAVQKEKEAGQLEEWFRGMEADSYRERLRSSQGRLQTLKTARDCLEDDLRRLQGLTRSDTEESLRGYQKYFRDAMEKIERELDQYQKSYLIVSTIFENGGNGL
ncbi:MAG TPA: hypothetical protein H9672_10025 [Firmicutes bacterium]|nr:hypothetical protein [Bacillota bacterium]